MKNSGLICTAVFLLLNCSPPAKEKVISKKWLGLPVNFEDVVPAVNTYHMFDSTGTKVGSMIFGTYFEDDMLVSRDTSQFDDGSVYETASFALDTGTFTLRKINIEMAFTTAKLNVDLDKSGGKVVGDFKVTRDTVANVNPIDSAYVYDVFREELYMLMHTIDFSESDSIKFSALVPTSMSLSEASITYAGEETIEVPNGKYLCDVIWLKADGKMPDNKIWIRKDAPRKIVKFHVPGPELSIELVAERN
ncbi:MAG: hypothetical protein ABJP45_05290 [Cyclobacteriaceae bacterium]